MDNSLKIIAVFIKFSNFYIFSIGISIEIRHLVNTSEGEGLTKMFLCQLVTSRVNH